MEYDDQNIEHQLKDMISESSTKNFKKSSTKLNVKAILYTPKEKGWTITFAEITFKNLDVGSNYDTSSISSNNRQKINMTKHTASDSKAQLVKKK